jgi:hypothetical protein
MAFPPGSAQLEAGLANTAGCCLVEAHTCLSGFLLALISFLPPLILFPSSFFIPMTTKFHAFENVLLPEDFFLNIKLFAGHTENKSWRLGRGKKKTPKNCVLAFNG